MPCDLPIRCVCGALSGVLQEVTPQRGNRVVCYCDDCQSFAYFLGNAELILDAHGGSDIFQISPAHLEIQRGREHLACMRLTPRGLVRWYASCCRTPIGNTAATRRVPLVGLLHNCLPDDGPRDEAIGPVRAKINARFATGDRATLEANDRAPASMIFRFLRIVLVARIRGEHRRSPFFDAKTGELIEEPKVLSAEELREVEAIRDRQ